MGHHARVDVDEVMTSMRAEARSAVADTHAHGGAIPGDGQPRRRRHLGVGETPDAAERVDDDLALQLDLHVGVDVLPPASSASRGDIWARRRDSTCRGLLDRPPRRGRSRRARRRPAPRRALREGLLRRRRRDRPPRERARLRPRPWQSGEGARASVRRSARRNVSACNPSRSSRPCCRSTRAV